MQAVISAGDLGTRLQSNYTSQSLVEVEGKPFRRMSENRPTFSCGEYQA